MAIECNAKINKKNDIAGKNYHRRTNKKSTSPQKTCYIEKNAYLCSRFRKVKVVSKKSIAIRPLHLKFAIFYVSRAHFAFTFCSSRIGAIRTDVLTNNRECNVGYHKSLQCNKYIPLSYYLYASYSIMQTALCKLHNAVCIISKIIRIFAAGNY